MKMEHNCPFCSWLFWRDSIDTVCTYVDVGVEFTGGEWTLINPTDGGRVAVNHTSQSRPCGVSR